MTISISELNDEADARNLTIMDVAPRSGYFWVVRPMTIIPADHTLFRVRREALTLAEKQYIKEVRYDHRRDPHRILKRSFRNDHMTTTTTWIPSQKG